MESFAINTKPNHFSYKFKTTITQIREVHSVMEIEEDCEEILNTTKYTVEAASHNYAGG